MLETSIFLKEKNLPDFIKEHKAFTEIENIKKIFPSLGLPNFSAETDIKNSDAIGFASSLIYKITYQLSDAHYFFSRKEEKYKPIAAICSNALLAINEGHTRMLKEQEVSGKLSIQQEILDIDKKVFAPVGISLFKLHGKINEILVKDYNYVNLNNLEASQEFKDYSANNISGKMKIIFSAAELQGAWDLATMSGRGIRSCQSWDGQYKECLIGSIADPYTGIIYTTTGSKLQLGTKMIRRCIVRFIVNKETNEQFIFLDKMYPAIDNATLNAFKKEISSRVNPKIKLIDHYQVCSFKDYFIPNNPHTDILLKYRRDKQDSDINFSGNHNQHNILSYRDTLIEFKKKPSVLDALKKAKVIKEQLFKNSCYTYLASTTNLSYEYTSLIEQVITKEIFDKVELDETMYPSHILRKSCLIYFKNSKAIIGKIKEEVLARQKKRRVKSPLLSGVNHLLIGDKESKITLSEFIDTQFSSFISSYMLDIWNGSIQKPVKRAPAKKAKK